jgi:hypothetical protein
VSATVYAGSTGSPKLVGLSLGILGLAVPRKIKVSGDTGLAPPTFAAH